MSPRCSLSILAAFAAGFASAAPTLNTTNGHYYDLVTGISPTWGQANAAASTMGFSANGKFYQGYLATVTSAAENGFIVGLGNVAGLYLGAQYTGPARDQYSWVTGEAFGYANWAGGEPNGDSGTIQYAWYSDTGVWNDLPYDQYAGTRFVSGYVVEFSAVPGPAAGVAFALGFLRRRRRQ